MKTFKNIFSVMIAIVFLAACAPAAIEPSPTPSPIPPTETPAPTEQVFTQVDIYLIALGDAGARGEEIGCEDSVVPVQVDIDPAQGTSAAIRSAYNVMFTRGDEIAERENLYNVFSQSDLQVDEVSLEDQTAVIRLTGQLMLGGVCDNPRVSAQLRETALQFSAVEQVEIFLNETPLEEVLSLQG